MTETVRGLSGFHHVALRARDFDASVRFYTQGLGLACTLAWGEGDGRAVMLDAGNGNCMEIFAGGSPARASAPEGRPAMHGSPDCAPEGRPAMHDSPDCAPEAALLHVAFRTADCDRALEAARAAGATVTQEPSTVTIPSAKPTTVRIAFCRGPDGELLEFFQAMGA